MQMVDTTANVIRDQSNDNDGSGTGINAAEILPIDESQVWY